jgi:hypothetical protein
VSRLIASHAKGRSGGARDVTVQRAVVLLDVTPDDYALQKVLVGLEPSNLTMLEKPNEVGVGGSSPPFLIPYKALFWGVATAAKRKNISLVEKDEDIHVVGHGGYGGRVWTAPNHGGEVTNFARLAGDIEKITPPDWAGTVKFRTCYSDVGDSEDPSVVEKTKAALGHARVEGSAGFAYGMGTHLPGESKVLKSEYDALYKGDTYDASVAEHLLRIAAVRPAARRKIALNLDVTSTPRAAWDAFVARMKQLENEMKTIVQSDIYAGLTSLERARALAQDDAFNAAVKAQYELFNAFSLWR